jgi:hypothetical protein
MSKDRRYFLTAVGLLSFFSALRLPFLRKRGGSTSRDVISCAPGGQAGSKAGDKAETKLFLGEDGRLMEVDISRIKMLKEKISDEELKKWVKKSGHV